MSNGVVLLLLLLLGEYLGGGYYLDWLGQVLLWADVG